MKKILVLDTFNFLHRAYHALPTSFTDRNGEPINAVYGVASMIITVLQSIHPEYVIAALDSEKPTFRVEDFTAYKAHRKPMENELQTQIPKAIEIIEAFGIKPLKIEGYEADDIIGTVASRFGNDYEVVIVSNDRDLWQLVNGRVTVMIPTTKGSAEFIGPDEVVKRMGFGPDKIADYKGLRGDPSDNIPGVFGVGEKTAKALIDQYGSVEEIYRNIGEISPVTLQNKLVESAEQAVMSKQLATIITDAPLTFDLKDCLFNEYDTEKLKEILEKYNFKSLLKRLSLDEKSQEVANKDQVSLF